MKEYAAKAVTAAREAVGNTVEEGNAMATHNVSIADIVAKRFSVIKPHSLFQTVVGNNSNRKAGY